MFQKISLNFVIEKKIRDQINCTSKDISYNFLDLAKKQSFQGLSYDIFDKRSQPQYTSINNLYIILV
jgi:hypothetical protein